jgi:hypothetical protein
VRDFSLLTLDERYSIPTMRFLTAASVPRAREHAERILGESPHHLGIEVWAGEVLQFRIQQHDMLEQQGEAAARNPDARPSQGMPPGRKPLYGA